MESHIEAWLALGFEWREFFTLTPYATAKATRARSRRVHDDIVKGSYQAAAFARTKRMKPLKAYQTKKLARKDGNEQARMLEAFGITPTEIEEAKAERDRLKAAGEI